MKITKSLVLMAIALFFHSLIIAESSLGELGRKDLLDRSGVASTSRKLLRASSPGSGTCQLRLAIYGYPCEEHTVTTKDGYILSVQRIPAGGRSGSSSINNKGPVLLQHGLLVDGFTWLLNSPSESLGYILADNGYDVWIANSRGTVYSLGHTSLSSDDPAYWDWSWDELAAYDLPATVGYVHQQTGQQKIHYVGHSLGTLIALASFSEGNNLINMIKSAALLSPIAYLNQIPSIFLQGAARLYLGEQLYWLGIARLNPAGAEVKNLLEKVCKVTGFDCYDLLTAFTGKNCCLNSTSFQVLLEHEPQSTSTKNMVHIAQTMRRGVISKYDYDNIVTNLKHYGQITPPLYNMARIPKGFPVFISYGKDDVLSDVHDVSHLLGVLDGHQTNDLTVNFVKDYAHADFIMAVNANKLVYDPLMDFFKHH